MKNRILIIDDDEELVDLYSTSLKLHDYEVLRAPDGIEGIRILREEKKIDLVILDLKMPKMSGEKFLRLIRTDKDLKDTKVLVMSSTIGNWDNEDAQGNLYEIRNLREDIAKDADKYKGKLTIIDGKFEKVPFVEDKHDFKERIRNEIIFKVQNALKKLNYNIFIIGQDKDLVKIYSRILLDNGYKVQGFVNELPILEALKKEPVDLVLMDLKESSQKNEEFISKIKSDPTLAAVKILVLCPESAIQSFKTYAGVSIVERKYVKTYVWYLFVFRYSEKAIKQDFLKQIRNVLNDEKDVPQPL